MVNREWGIVSRESSIVSRQWSIVHSQAVKGLEQYKP